MNIAQTAAQDKSQELVEMTSKLQQFVVDAAAEGMSQYDAEKGILARALEIGHRSMDLLLSLQGDGDLGETVETEEGQTLYRSEKPVERPLRSVFGEHALHAYVYAPGSKKKIALRPIDARLNLPEGKCSYLFEEFSQYFCVEQAFGQAAKSLEKVLGQKLSVDTLERTNQRVGEQAEQFLDTLPAPPAEEEGEILVATADGKGVPLIREQAEAVPVHGPKPARPNNRRMATLAAVYSVDPHVRTAEDVVAALFRDERPETDKKKPRPRPCHKRMTACFSTVADEGTEDEMVLRGDVQAWTWAAAQIDSRRRKGQTLVRVCDGQQSLWRISDICLGLDVQNEQADSETLPADSVTEPMENTTSLEHPTKPAENPTRLTHHDVVDVLDIIHVASYLWLAARAFLGSNENAVERFVRERLLRILQGQAAGVIVGMRRMASSRDLRGEKRKQVNKACDYFQKHLPRMRYDEYLARGYPIASGVIEGACRHLVKDRMERTGMRWRESNAGAMLFTRAVKVTDLWEPFQAHRQEVEEQRLHPHHALLGDYTPTYNIAI